MNFLSMTKRRNSFAFTFGLMALFHLAGCASSAKVTPERKLPPPIEDRAIVDGKALPLPEGPDLQIETVQERKVASPVVKRLIASARTQRQSRDWDGASGSLERALRIEPRNPSLWSALAEIKCEQGAWQKCIQLAAKSNTLSGTDSTLRRRNWHLMATAHNASGDSQAAQKFLDKLAK